MSCNHSFALYRLPLSEEVVEISGTARILPSLREVGQCPGFVVSPFSASPSCPLVLLSAEHEQVSKQPLTFPSAADYARAPLPGAPSADYAAQFECFATALRMGRFDKLVLSRQSFIASVNEPDARSLFQAACRLYPRMFVALVSTPLTGTWLTATPEIILEGKDSGTWRTMALAGTMRWEEDREPEWGPKDRREQRVVADYLERQLQAASVAYEERGPFTVQAGGLLHLCTEFTFRLTPPELGPLVERLHPTPAVCGMPKEEAARFILDHETLPRRYYSGFMGPVSLRRTTHLAVTLRCMEIGQDGVRLYAGGGLLAESRLEAEWGETENKMNTMRRLF